MKHKHGGDIYSMPDILDFSANINPLGMPKNVQEAAKLGIEKAIYYPEVGSKQLRDEISKYYNLDSEHVICGNGAAEIIFYICLAEQPKKALLLAPSFAEYEIALKNVGCEVNYCYLKEADNFMLTQEYMSYITDDLDIIFLCNPNNPTGQMITKEFLIQIVQRCREKQIKVVLDECFIDFSDKLLKQSMRDELKNYENLVIINAFTKLYAMPGLRLGYALSTNKVLLNKMHQLLQPWNVSVPAQFAGIAALKEKEYVIQSREVLKNEKEFLVSELSYLQKQYEQGKSDIIKKVFGYEANYIFFRGSNELAQILQSKGIQIRDCSNYRGLEKGYYRIAIRSHEENQRLISAMNYNNNCMD